MSEELLCPHVDFVDTLNCGKKILKPTLWQCRHYKCNASSNSLFGCLTCGHISCVDDNHEGHAQQHCDRHKRRQKHPIAIDINSHQIWCFLCQQQIHNDTPTLSIQVLISSLKALQELDTNNEGHITRSGKRFGSNNDNDDNDDVIMVSSRKVKEFEEKDKIDNAEAHYQMMLLRRIFNHWRINKTSKKTEKVNKPKKKTLSGNKRKRDVIENDEKEIDNDTDIKNGNISISPPPKKKLKRTPTRNFAGRTGLRNLGNTCYFNSSVQCLNSTDTFRKFFLNLPGLVPNNALTAPLPDLPALKSKKKSKKREVRTVQTRASLKKRNRRKTTRNNNNNNNNMRSRGIGQERRRSARLREQRNNNNNTTDDDDDVEMSQNGNKSDTASLSEISSLTTEGNEEEEELDDMSTDSASPSFVAPSRLLLRRRTTLLHATMEDDKELKENVPISLSAEIYSLLRIFESGKWAVITPQRLSYSIWNTMPQFRSYRQQDAQEFLSLFLQRLEQEIKAFDQYNDNTSKSILLSPNNNNNHNMMMQRPLDYVKESFECSLISETVCNECENKSYYRPPGDKFISLDIYPAIEKILNEKKKEFERKEREKEEEEEKEEEKEEEDVIKKRRGRGRGRRRGRRSLNYGNGINLTYRHLQTERAFDRALKSYDLCSLIDLLNTSMIDPKILCGDNKYECDQCKKKVVAIKRDFYNKLPNVLIIHLCRAYYNMKNDKQEKLQNHIKFPLKNLRMTPYCFKNGKNGKNEKNENENECIDDSKYDLVAALVHNGKSMNMGHYISYCYHRETERWLKFDDMRVSVTTSEKVKQSQAYLLFYEKKNISNWVDNYIHHIQQQMTTH